MRHSELTMRYVRATIITAVSVALIPAVFFAAAYWAVMSPDWDPNGDSGAAQGFGLFALAAFIAVASAVVVFPFVARFLIHRQRLTSLRFFLYSVGCFAIGSALLAAATAPLLGYSLTKVSGWDHVATVFAMLLVGVTALAGPFCPLWLWLAQMPHNSTPNSDARKSGARRLA